jgi:hypothetical protein
MQRALCFLVFSLLATSSLSALEYRVLELPTLPGQSTSIRAGETAPATAAFGLSNRAADDEAGVYVVGMAGGRAVRWTVRGDLVGAPEDLGAPAAAASIAYGVNDAGHVVGTAGGNAFFWSQANSSPFQLIPSPASIHCSAAQGINNHDLIVGTCTDAKKGAEGTASWAFGWTPGGSLILYKGDHRSTHGSRAFAINDGDVIAGDAEASSAVVQAYKWNAGALRIGALAATSGTAGQATSYGINDRQDLVGESEGQAFVALHGVAPVSLGFQGAARGINHSRTIVGEMANGRAFVKPATGQAEDLNTLLSRGSGLTLEAAYAVNDKGWIVGVGTQADGMRKGFLLIPE